MSLRVTRLRLKDFRSYESLEMEPDEKLTIIVGSNAVGKTNIIEALQLLTSSFVIPKPPLGRVCAVGGGRGVSPAECGG